MERWFMRTGNLGGDLQRRTAICSSSWQETATTYLVCIPTWKETFVIKCPYSGNCYCVASTRVHSTSSPGPTAISFADTIVCEETAIVILVELCHVSIHYTAVTLYHVTIHYIPVALYHVTIHYIPVSLYNVTIHDIPVSLHHVTLSHIVMLLRVTFHVRKHST